MRVNPIPKSAYVAPAMRLLTATWAKRAIRWDYSCTLPFKKDRSFRSGLFYNPGLWRLFHLNCTSVLHVLDDVTCDGDIAVLVKIDLAGRTVVGECSHRFLDLIGVGANLCDNLCHDFQSIVGVGGPDGHLVTSRRS